MKLRQPFFHKLPTGAGWILFVGGFLLLATRMDSFGDQWSAFAERFSTNALGFLPAFGLASLQVTHAFLYDRTAFFSGAAQFLVSCWPLAFLLTGAVLLYTSSTRRSRIAMPTQRSIRGDR